MPVFFIRQRTAITYQGPGDIVSGATAWYGLRAYNAAYATGSNNAINVRRASDNSTSNIVILANGNLDIATANTFAGVDATATATVSASTTIALTGASSTPHVGSTITGTGVTQPCYIVSVGSFVAGAGNITVNAAQTLAAVSISMQYGLYVTEAYDQSGNGYNVTQATAGSQPQLLPSFLNGLPGILGTGGGQFIKVATFATIAQPISMSTVLARTSNFTTKQVVIANGTIGVGLQWAAAANIITMVFGGNGNATMSDSAWHALQVVANSTSSFLNVDGTDTPESVGSTGMTAASGLTWFCEANGVAGANNAGATEMGIWPLGFNSTQRGSLHSNQSAYWGTP